MKSNVHGPYNLAPHFGKLNLKIKVVFKSLKENDYPVACVYIEKVKWISVSRLVSIISNCH
jgi:hypothetical protein